MGNKSPSYKPERLGHPVHVSDIDNLLCDKERPVQNAIVDILNICPPCKCECNMEVYSCTLKWVALVFLTNGAKRN